MALLFIEGFDGYSVPADVNRKWAESTVSESTLPVGRTGIGKSLTFYGGRNSPAQITTPNYGNKQTVVVGFAFANKNLVAPFTLLKFRDDTTSQIELNFSPTTGLLSVKSNGDTLGTGTTILSDNVWYYLELKLTVDAGSGVVHLKINEADELNLTSQDTQVTGNAYSNMVTFSKPSTYRSGYCLDDIYILDDSGSVNNDFLGDVKVVTLFTSGAGNTTQWTSVPTQANYLSTQSTGATSGYVQTSTTGQKDTYQFDNLPISPDSIAAVAVNVFVRNTTGTNNDIKAVVRSGGTDYDSSAKTYNTTDYTCLQFIHEENPNTSAAWSESEVNGAEFGMKLFA